jgi:hypothetical protein
MAEILLTDARPAKSGAIDIADSNSTGGIGSTGNTAVLAKAALQRSRIYTLRRLQVEQHGDAIVLRGRVESFYHKQLAQELIRTAVDGVEVINGLQVVYTRDRSLTESDCYSP